MSRTKRSIPHWYRILEAWMTPEDLKRDKIYNGYDGGMHSYIYESYPTCGWDDDYRGKSKKFYKRRFSKQRRRKALKENYDE